MHNHDATEIAYKNGYEAGYAKGKEKSVEVVRCISCKKRNTVNCPFEDIYHEYPWLATKHDDFCSYGERRTEPDCHNCTKKCPQAERAHETALGRMYATQELVKLVKKLEAGELVDVVRCIKCRNAFLITDHDLRCLLDSDLKSHSHNHFCGYGKPRDT